MSPCDAIADKLRRVTAERDALRKALEDAREVIQWHGAGDYELDDGMTVEVSIDAALALGDAP